MKIIASSKIKKNSIEGILLVLTKLGHDCFIWDRNIKPFFDMLDEQKPDILFITPNEEQALSIGQSEKTFKTVFFGFGEPTGQSNLWCVPYQSEKLSQERKTYIFNDYANTIKYSGKVDESPQHSYDLVYFTEETSQEIKPQIISFISEIFNNIAIKKNIRFGIFGDNSLNFNEYLGKVSAKDKATLMKNCKIGIDLFGENYMDFAIFKKPCITPFANPIFLSCINIKDFYDLLGLYLLNENELRDNVSKTAYKNIFEKKLTDCHITAEIFNQLGYTEISEKCLTLLNQ
jgi:hypothetical protein